MKRAKKTAEFLAEALRELMKETPIEKIPIKSITDYCGLNRQTFYYHFKDIYDLVEWMYLRDIDDAVRKTQFAMDGEEALQEFLAEVDNDRAFHVAIYQSSNYYPRLRREFSDLALEILLPLFEDRFQNAGYDEGYKDFLLRMYALILFEYIERRALGVAVSSDDSFTHHWTRCLQEQYLGAPVYRDMIAESNSDVE